MDHRTHRAAQRIEGRPAAPGIALGPLMRLSPAKPDMQQRRAAAEEAYASLGVTADNVDEILDGILARYI